MRIRFDAAGLAACPWSGRILKPATAPVGYTPHTVVIEWLTLNCVGDWAGRHRKRWLAVGFAQRADALLARSHLTGLGLWVAVRPEDDAGLTAY